MISLGATDDALCALTAQRAFCWGSAAGSKANTHGIFDPNEVEVAVLSGSQRRAVKQTGSFPPECSGDDLPRVLVRCDTVSSLPFILESSPALGLTSLDNIVKVVATNESACVLAVQQAHRKVYCFGQSWSSLRGERGQDRRLGEPNGVALEDVSAIVAKERTVCALSRGEVFCWGDGRYFPPGVLKRDQTRFVDAVFDDQGEFGCFLSAGGAMVCGLRGDYQRIDALRDVAQIVLTEGKRICARKRDGQVACIERDGTIHTRPVLSPAKQLVDGLPCALLIDGPVRCESWTREGVAAGQMELPGRARAIKGGEEWTLNANEVCAINERGAVLCWGTVGRDWMSGAVMMGMMMREHVETKPQPIPGPTDAVALVGNCVRERSGRVWHIGLATGADLKKLRLRAHRIREADSAIRLEPPEGGPVPASCLARRADGSVLRVWPDWPPIASSPFAIGPPHVAPYVQEDPQDELGAGFVAPTFEVGLHQGIKCALRPDFGVACREAKLDKVRGPLFDPLLRSTLPMRVIPP